MTSVKRPGQRGGTADKSRPAAIQRFASLTVRASLNATSCASRPFRPARSTASLHALSFCCPATEYQDLDIVLILIRPQPRRIVVAWRIGVEHRFCRRHRLILGEGPGLDAQAVVMMLRHIPGSKDERIRRSPGYPQRSRALFFSPASRASSRLRSTRSPPPPHHKFRAYRHSE